MNNVTTNFTVETILVSSEDGANTYSITKRFSGIVGDKAVIVLLYPTRNSENIRGDDTTLTHLVNHSADLGLCEFTVINLFSQVVKTKLSAKGLEVDTDNLEYIDKEIMSKKNFKDTKFVLAYGSSMETSAVCNEMKENLVKLFYKHCPKGMIYQLATPSMPQENCPHPLWLGIRAKFETWYLTECTNIPAVNAKENEKAKTDSPKKKANGREFVELKK